MAEPILTELASDASPEFIDAASCKAWIESVPLANVSAAQNQLLTQIEEFNRFPTKATTRLDALEVIREAVNFVQIEQAKRFSNRALPMLEAENAVFEDTIDLWEQMRLGYARCLDAAAAGEPGMRSYAGIACQRMLAYAGLKMFHHYRAYREVPGRDWQALHRGYAKAEELGVTEEAVKDFLNRDVHDTSPRIAYMRAVMLGLANPNEQSQRQLTFVAFLLERWGEKIDIARKPVKEGNGDEALGPLVIELSSDRAPERVESLERVPPGEVRFLDTRRLAKSLRNRIALLRKGESPAKLMLGEDCVQPSCEQMLVFLYRQWCQPKLTRAERRRANDSAQVCNDVNAIHYYVGGRVFRQPGEAKELSQKEREEIATFGRVSTRDEDDYSVAQGILLENWHIENETAQGLRLVRRAGDRGRRYAHGQLVCLRPADTQNFLLAQVRWLMSTLSGDLYAGVQLLPGLPAAVAARPTGLNAMKEKFVQALTLTGVPAINVPPTLVLPSGWYKPKRVIEVFVDAPLQVRLTALIERGVDFERVTYESLG